MKKHLSFYTLLGLLAGIFFGSFFSARTDQIAFIGSWYIAFLKYMIVPVVFTSITVSVYDSRSLKNHLVLWTVVLFALMFIATFLLSSLIIRIIDPAKGFLLEEVEWTGSITHFAVGEMLLNLIPKDLNRFLTGSYLFFVIAVSFLTGYLCSLFPFGEKFISLIR